MSIDAEAFQLRRRELAKNLNGGLIVVAANRLMQRRNDTTYEFSQNSDFLYLTGIDQPDWMMVYDGSRDYTYIIQPKLTSTEKLFDGDIDTKNFLIISGADEVVDSDDFEKLLRDLSRKHSNAYTSILPKRTVGERVVVNPAQQKLRRVLERIFNSTMDCNGDIARLRAIKSDDELVAIAKAVDVTVAAFEAVRKNIDDCKYEYEVEAYLGYHFRKSGAKHAYEPIVASGNRACTLHYVANNQAIRKGQAVLIDAGAEIDGYSADITRTYIRGKPTKRYIELHTALQEVHQKIIDIIEPHMPIGEYFRQVDILMQQALLGVGLLRSPTDDRYRQYFPHSVSHGLGLDVHDSLGGFRTLDVGMVLTVEPGIYIDKEKIGIRLEDDIVVTKSGRKNLSQRLSTNY